MTRRGAMCGLALFLAGCGRAQKKEDFVPPEGAARAALEAYLKGWAEGKPADLIPGTPQVMVSDGQRGKRTLTAYEILGQVPADAPCCFAVKLTLGNPAGEVRDRYVVVGIDPIWVIRHEDYEMLTHWSHPVPADKKGLTAPPKK